MGDKETFSLFIVNCFSALSWNLMFGQCISLYYELMWGIEKDKERERYYLLPGQGGRSARRKHRRILLWSIIVGLFASAVFVGVMYLLTNSLR
jgi:hypothetical protein